MALHTNKLGKDTMKYWTVSRVWHGAEAASTMSVEKAITTLREIAHDQKGARVGGRATNLLKDIVRNQTEPQLTLVKDGTSKAS